jgi:hypothetical protein
MHERPALLCRQVGRADQVKNSEILRVRTRNRAHRCQFTHPVRGTHRADAAHAGIAIGGVAGIKLVAASDPINRRMLNDRVIDGKRVIPGDPEDIVNANLIESSQDVGADGFGHATFSNSRRPLRNPSRDFSLRLRRPEPEAPQRCRSW